MNKSYVLSYVLVNMKMDFSDEFDCEAFFCGPLGEWQRRVDYVRENFASNFHAYFGTNECLMFDDVQEWEESMTRTPITESEYEIFKKFFPLDYKSEDVITFGTGKSALDPEKYCGDGDGY